MSTMSHIDAMCQQFEAYLQKATKDLAMCDMSSSSSRLFTIFALSAILRGELTRDESEYLREYLQDSGIIN